MQQLIFNACSDQGNGPNKLSSWLTIKEQSQCEAVDSQLRKMWVHRMSICRRAQRSRRERYCLLGNDWHPVSFITLLSGSCPNSFCQSLYVPSISTRKKLTSPVFCNLGLMYSHLDLGHVPVVSSLYNTSWPYLLFITAFQSHWFFGLSLLGIGLWGQSKEVYCQSLSLQLFSLGNCQISRKLPLFRWK